MRSAASLLPDILHGNPRSHIGISHGWEAKLKFYWVVDLCDLGQSASPWASVSSLMKVGRMVISILLRSVRDCENRNLVMCFVNWEVALEEVQSVARKVFCRQGREQQLMQDRVLPCRLCCWVCSTQELCVRTQKRRA